MEVAPYHTLTLPAGDPRTFPSVFGIIESAARGGIELISLKKSRLAAGLGGETASAVAGPMVRLPDVASNALPGTCLALTAFTAFFKEG